MLLMPIKGNWWALWSVTPKGKSHYKGVRRKSFPKGNGLLLRINIKGVICNGMENHKC